MRILCACFLICLFYSGTPANSSLEDLIALHKQAVNAEALAEMKSVRKVGMMNFGTNQVPFTSYQKGNNFRLEQRFGGLDMFSVLNEEGAWKLNPWDGNKIEKLGGGELRKLKELSMSGGILIDGERFGYTASLKKEDESKDHPVIHVDCGENAYYKVHLNPESYLIDKTIFYESANGRNTKVELIIKEYAEFGKVKFPSEVREFFQGEALASYSIISIDTRLDLDLKLFKTPDGGE